MSRFVLWLRLLRLRWKISGALAQAERTTKRAVELSYMAKQAEDIGDFMLVESIQKLRGRE